MNFRGFIFLTLLAVIIWQILIFAPTETEKIREEPKFDKFGQIDRSEKSPQWMSKIYLIESDKGEKDWELWADRARAQADGKSWSLQAVKVFFYENGKVKMKVTGKSGVININTKDMQIQGSVHMSANNGYEFDTESLNYRASDRRLDTKVRIRMLGPQKRNRRRLDLAGIGMKAELNSGLIDIFEKVVAKMQKKGRGFTVSSKKAQFSLNSRKAVFTGNVIIDVNTLRVTGRRARFRYSKDELDSAKVDGGIRVSDLDKWATSKTVDIEFDTDKYVFRGSPKLVQNNDEMIGKVITFLDGGKVIKVDNAEARVDKDEVRDHP